ncbi:MAG: SIMPL domain-containing protein [Myxococcota bacterium]|nr:SIMPL domain-containing protein [Myxococcota bacterium]
MSILPHFLTLILGIFCLPVQAAPATAKTLTITGEAEVNVVPDRVILSVTVESRDSSLTQTQKKNDKVVKAFLNYWAQTLKNPPKDVQTDYFNVSPRYRSCKYNDSPKTCDPSEILFYVVQKNIHIQLNDIRQYEGLINKIFALGIHRIHHVRFVTTQSRKHSDTARALAATAAKEKAEAVAQTLDMKVKKPISIDVDYLETPYHRPEYRSLNASSRIEPLEGGSTDAPTLALGQLRISARVKVVFEIE